MLRHSHSKPQSFIDRSYEVAKPTKSIAAAGAVTVACISRPLSSAGATGNERELFVIELVVFHVGSSAG